MTREPHHGLLPATYLHCWSCPTLNYVAPALHLSLEPVNITRKSNVYCPVLSMPSRGNFAGRTGVYEVLAVR
jgi:hypothetical protein